LSFFRLEDWNAFEDQISDARAVCEKRGQEPDAHFESTSRTGSAVQDLPVMEPDVMLSAYAGFLVAKQLDSHLVPVRFCLNYFPASDRSWQALSLRMDEWERLTAREQLRHEERQFSGIAFGYFRDGEGMGLFKSAGDQALFGYSTRDMKERLGIPQSQPLFDFLPAVTLRAKLFAEEKTLQALQSNPRRTEDELVQLYRDANLEARQVLLKEWIRPEFLPVLDDIDLVETRFRKELQAVAKRHLEG
jgi:DNA-damage-inducible protein D